KSSSAPRTEWRCSDFYSSSYLGKAGPSTRTEVRGRDDKNKALGRAAEDPHSPNIAFFSSRCIRRQACFSDFFPQPLKPYTFLPIYLSDSTFEWTGGFMRYILCAALFCSLLGAQDNPAVSPPSPRG